MRDSNGSYSAIRKSLRIGVIKPIENTGEAFIKKSQSPLFRKIRGAIRIKVRVVRKVRNWVKIDCREGAIPLVECRGRINGMPISEQLRF